MKNQDNKNDSFQSLSKKWFDFFGIILSPSVLLVLLTTIALIYFSPTEDVPDNILSILTVIISIFAGVVGALISKKWSEINDGSILVTRGKSAIRGLKLLLLNLSSLEHRVNIHLNRLNKQETSLELSKSNLEEIIERCNTLQEEALNAVEEWQDIIPEANIKTQIGIISQLKEGKTNLENQIQNLNNELNTAKNKSEENKIELNERLKEKEKELENVQEKLFKKEREFNSSLLSGMPSYLDAGVKMIELNSSNPTINSGYKCDDCGNEFKISNTPGMITISTPDCPECGSSNVTNKFFYT